MSHWYLPHLYAPETPEMPEISYADLAEYDGHLMVETLEGEAVLIDAFGNETHAETNVWVVIVRGRKHTQIGAAFGTDADEAMDAAMHMACDHEDEPMTADLIRPLGRIAPVDDLLVTALSLS